MARRARSIKRAEVMPDAKYQSLTVSKLMNRIMKRGKKSRAEEIVYGALDTMGKQGSKDPVTDMESAIKNITPQLKVKSRRVGGATYQVPVEVPPNVGMSVTLTVSNTCRLNHAYFLLKPKAHKKLTKPFARRCP